MLTVAEDVSLGGHIASLGGGLPLEMWLKIFSLSPRTAQISVICTCRAFFKLHAPSLYRNVYIPRNMSLLSLCFFLKSLVARPELAACVRHFDFAWKSMQRSWGHDGGGLGLPEEYYTVLQLVRPVLLLMPRLHTLIIPNGYWISHWDAAELPPSLEYLCFMPPATADAALGRLTRVTRLMAYDGDGDMWSELPSFGRSGGRPLSFIKGGASLLRSVLQGRGLAAGCTAGLTSFPDRPILALLQQSEDCIESLCVAYRVGQRVGSEWDDLRFVAVRRIEVAVPTWLEQGIEGTVAILNAILPSFPAATMLLLSHSDKQTKVATYISKENTLSSWEPLHSVIAGSTAASLQTIVLSPLSLQWSRNSVDHWEVAAVVQHEVSRQWYDAPEGF